MKEVPSITNWCSFSLQIHETVETINQLKVQREFMLGFARDPQQFISQWLVSQASDLKVNCQQRAAGNCVVGRYWNWVRGYVRPWRPHFHAVCKTPISALFPFSKDPPFTPNHKFLENLGSEDSKLAKTSVPKSQIETKFTSHGYILFRISIH